MSRRFCLYVDIGEESSAERDDLVAVDISRVIGAGIRQMTGTDR